LGAVRCSAVPAVVVGDLVDEGAGAAVVAEVLVELRDDARDRGLLLVERLHQGGHVGHHVPAQNRQQGREPVGGGGGVERAAKSAKKGEDEIRSDVV